jgi:hypothetical protein
LNVVARERPGAISAHHSEDITMRKIKLSIESLRVESFDTAAAERGNGTIFGNAKTLAVDTCAVGDPCFSAIDTCPSSPHAATQPCNGCQGEFTEFCEGELTEFC